MCSESRSGLSQGGTGHSTTRCQSLATSSSTPRSPEVLWIRSRTSFRLYSDGTPRRIFVGQESQDAGLVLQLGTVARIGEQMVRLHTRSSLPTAHMYRPDSLVLVISTRASGNAQYRTSRHQTEQHPLVSHRPDAHRPYRLRCSLPRPSLC